jgi:hypothetical protein
VNATVSFKMVLTPATGPAVVAGPAHVTTTLPPGLGTQSGQTYYVSAVGTLAANMTYNVSITTTAVAQNCSLSSTAGTGSFTTS